MKQANEESEFFIRAKSLDPEQKVHNIVKRIAKIAIFPSSDQTPDQTNIQIL